MLRFPLPVFPSTHPGNSGQQVMRVRAGADREYLGAHSERSESLAGVNLLSTAEKHKLGCLGISSLSVFSGVPGFRRRGRCVTAMRRFQQSTADLLLQQAWKLVQCARRKDGPVRADQLVCGINQPTCSPLCGDIFVAVCFRGSRIGSVVCRVEAFKS